MVYCSISCGKIYSTYWPRPSIRGVYVKHCVSSNPKEPKSYMQTTYRGIISDQTSDLFV